MKANSMRVKLYKERLRWYRPAEYAKRRCNDPDHTHYKYYGGKGIKYRLTRIQVVSLYQRDNGDSLKQPSLDRIDPSGDYCFENCRFVERSENIGRPHRKSEAEVRREIDKINAETSWEDWE